MQRLPARAIAATIAAFGVTVALAVPAAAAQPESWVPVEVWVTTPDRSELLHQRETIGFTDDVSARTTIVVDPGRRYQTMDGFGASITDSSAALFAGLDEAARADALRSLFDPEDGIGVSFLRQPIGSSDFTAAAEHWTYDDVPAGQTDFGLEHFSIAHDEVHILPLLREAKRLNPELTIMATPWSPPAWMKTSGSLVGGRLIDDPAVYDAYARYLVKFVQAYAAAGVPIDLLTVQNEPQHRAPDAYPGTDMPVEQQEHVIAALGPLLAEASPATKILGYDHNWSTHPNDVANTPPGEDPATDYPYQLLEGPAAEWIDGVAYHCYSGDPSAQSALQAAHPDVDIWFTECSGSHGPDDTAEQIFRGTLTWHARTLTVGVPRNWGKSVVNWNIFLDEQGGPHLGGCGTCTGLLTLQDDGTVRTDAEYYTIGHLSKFVQPGAERIASTSFGTTGWNGQITDVAFRNPDGSTALVVHNENDDPRDFAVAVGGYQFEYTLPGGALATFTWPKSNPPGGAPTAIALDGATATASSAADDAVRAIDDDASTRWSSGQAQEPGQYLEVDLGAVRTFSRVDLDAGDNLGDYPRGWRVEISMDGTTWRTLAEGADARQLTMIETKPTRAQHLRVTATASSGNWWSIADLRLYR